MEKGFVASASDSFVDVGAFPQTIQPVEAVATDRRGVSQAAAATVDSGLPHSYVVVHHTGVCKGGL